MNFRGCLLLASCLAGPALAPAVAQLIHVSVDTPDGFLLFKADSGLISWNTSAGFITQLDFTFDSQATVGALEPARNHWRLRVENPELGKNFVLTRPFQSVTASEHALVFEYTKINTQVDEDIELTLAFDQPIPTDGSLPQFPLPALGTDFGQSRFSFFGGNSFFHVPHLAEAYGSIEIRSITTSLTPIPEPSVYGLAALMVVGTAIGLRRRKSLATGSACES
jgi:hypothetical protein